MRVTIPAALAPHNVGAPTAAKPLRQHLLSLRVSDVVPRYVERPRSNFHSLLKAPVVPKRRSCACSFDKVGVNESNRWFLGMHIRCYVSSAGNEEKAD